MIDKNYVGTKRKMLLRAIKTRYSTSRVKSLTKANNQNVRKTGKGAPAMHQGKLSSSRQHKIQRKTVRYSDSVITRN